MIQPSSTKKAQTFVVYTEPGAGEGAIGACGGIGSRESAWIEAHGANGRSSGLSIIVLEGLIIEAYGQCSREGKQIVADLSLFVRRYLFWVKGHECRGLRNCHTVLYYIHSA